MNFLRKRRAHSVNHYNRSHHELRDASESDSLSYCTAQSLLYSCNIIVSEHINSIVHYPQITRLSLFLCCADQSMYDTTASHTLGCLCSELTKSQHSEDKGLGAQIKLYSRGQTCCISTPVRLEDARLVSRILASLEDFLASANFRFIQTSSSSKLVIVEQYRIMLRSTGEA